MILGLSAAAFTQLHVAISLIGLLSGLATVLAMATSRNLRAVTAVFLAATALTSLTGFFFHSARIGPPHIVGAISLVVLAVAIWARYGRHMDGIWRPVYIVTAVIALYLNAFVGVVQAFQKIPALNDLAPKGSEPPFVATQLVVLAVAAALGFIALRRFHPKPRPPA